MEIISIIASSSIVFIVTWITGFLLYPLLLGKAKLVPPVAFFTRLAVGYIAVLTGISMYYTSCYTIFTGVFIILTTVIFLKRKEIEFTFNLRFLGDSKYLLTGLAILPIFLLLLMYRNGYFDEEIIYSSYQDNGVYATVAEYLKVTGVEVSSPWYQLYDVSADGIAKVYHYADLWFMAFTLGFSNLSTLDVYNYVFTSVLSLYSFFGYMAVCMSLKMHWSNFWLVAIPFMLVLFNMEIPRLTWTNYFDANIISYPRIAALPILSSLALVARRYKLRYIDIIAFSVLILSDAIFMPTVFLAVFSLCIYRLFLKNSIQNWAELLIVLMAGIFFVSFYYLFGSFDNSSVNINPFCTKEYFYYFAKNVAAVIFKNSIFFLPAYVSLIHLYFYQKKVVKFYLEYFGYLLAFLVFSACATAVLNNNVDSIQFIALVNTTASAFLVLGCLAALWNIPKNKTQRIQVKSVLICLLIMQMIYGVYATTELKHFRKFGVHIAFLNSLKPKLAHLNKIGAAISNTEKTNTYTVDPRICQYCNFLKQAGNGFWVNQITIPPSLEELKFKERTTALKLSPFFRFIQRLKAEGHYLSLEYAQLQFIERYNIDFVIVEKGAKVPEPIKQYVISSETDPYSGTSVLFMRQF